VAVLEKRETEYSIDVRMNSEYESEVGMENGVLLVQILEGISL
jgi:hypothetical protein